MTVHMVWITDWVDDYYTNILPTIEYVRARDRLTGMRFAL